MDHMKTLLHGQILCSTANLRTKILNLRGFDSSTRLILRVGFSGPKGTPQKFESTHLSRETLGREIGRMSNPWIRNLEGVTAILCFVSFSFSVLFSNISLILFNELFPIPFTSLICSIDSIPKSNFFIIQTKDILRRSD